MQRYKQHALVLPAQVFHKLRMVGVQRGLALHGQRQLAQRLTRGEKHGAQKGEPLQRVVRAVVGAVAVGPFVVAGCVDQCRRKQAKVLELGLELFVAAARRAGLEVADVDREIRLQAVDAANQRAVRRADFGGIAIGQVAQGDELEGLRVSGQGGSGQHETYTTAQAERKTEGRTVHSKPQGGWGNFTITTLFDNRQHQACTWLLDTFVHDSNIHKC